MAEQNSRNAVEIAAGRKLNPSDANNEEVVSVDWPTTSAFANGDTVGSGFVLRKGTRLTGLPLLSAGGGAASSTLSCGLRDATTLVAVDATAIFNAASLTSAQNGFLATGTKMITGQRYVLPQDCEIYFTLGGATPQANQAIRAEIRFAAP